MAARNILFLVLCMELGFGAYNFEVAFRFLGGLWTRVLNSGCFVFTKRNYNFLGLKYVKRHYEICSNSQWPQLMVFVFKKVEINVVLLKLRFVYK